MLRHPFFTKSLSVPLIGTGTKALNPGGAGATPPPPGKSPALSSHHTVETLGFSIAKQSVRAAPTTPVTSAF